MSLLDTLAAQHLGIQVLDSRSSNRYQTGTLKPKRNVVDGAIPIVYPAKARDAKYRVNRYYIQAEMGIQRTIKAKSIENARKNFLAAMLKEFPSLYEFIEDNITITCLHADGKDQNEHVGWIDK